MQLLIWLATVCGETVIRSFLMQRIEKLLGKPLDECEKEIDKAIEHASSVFHKYYGDRYGAPNSTFMDHEGNQKKLLRSTFPRGKRLTAADLNLEGFDGSSKASEEAANFFLKTFYDAIDQTSSRTLDRNLSLQEAKRERSGIREGVDRTEAQAQLTNAKIDGIDRKIDAALNRNVFPDTIRALITKPHLKKLSKLMEMGQAKDALAYAKERIKEIDAALKEDASPGNDYVGALRTYRQRLLLAAASAASWQGDIEAGRAFWWRACNLGSIDSEWHKQAAITLFNIGLKDELQSLVDQMDQTSEVYQKIAAPCLAYLEKDWSKVDKLLADAQSADKILQRVEARLRIIDFRDTDAVKLTARLLDQTDDDTVLPVVNLIRAQLTLDLIKRVIGEYTPLDYDRRPLINNLVNRIDVALNTTETDSFFRAQALGCLGIAAELLRDDELNERFKNEVGMLDGKIRSSVFPLHDSRSTPDKIHLLQAEGHFDANRAAILKAELYQDSVLPENVESELYEALYASVDKQQRKYALLLLTQHLRQTNRTEEARRLIDATHLRPADNWLVRAKNLPADETPLDIVNEVEAFPLDVGVIEHLAQFTLSTAKFISPENPQFDKADLNRAEEAVRWTTRLVEVLPSRSSRLRYAWALYAARCYKKLLTISQDLDPIYAEQAIEFEAWALIGLGRRIEAIDCFISASKIYPESIHFVVHAARFLLIENRPEEAKNLLEPHVTAGSQDPNILLFYAQSIQNQAPNSQDHAPRAFDLFVQAYDLQPDPNIAQRAWQAARAAGREQEAKRFFNAMMAEAPIKVVKTRDDFIQAMQAASDNRHAVQIEGGFEFMAEMVRKDGERSHLLGKFLRAHMLAYVDFFRHSGRSWEFWTIWTQQFKQRSSEGKISLGGFSVLADWPSVRPRYNRQHNVEDINLFLDRTAILTLGVLGPETAKQLLVALEKCYVQAGTLEELHQDLTRIEGHLLDGNAVPYVKAAHFFRQRRDAIVTYSDEIESAVPSDPDLGARRVDLGVAFFHNARYVTDSDNSQDWPDGANRLRISSAALLTSLHESGEVSADEAKDAAENYPNTFGEWKTASPQSIPEAIVFDEYSILDWIGTGLANILGSRVKIGPWVWMRISEESERQEAMELAHERLKDIRRVLQTAFDEGILVEIEANSDAGTQENVNEKPGEEALHIKELWSGALRSLQTAQSHEFQLWADDRFYTLLLMRLGGPTKIGPEIEAIRGPFINWAQERPPISTMELLDQLSSAECLTHKIAQDAAAKLFAQGYRTAHPILLTHTLRQFPVPKSGSLTYPFRELASAITEIPHYFTRTFDDLYGNRDGFIRMAAMGMAERLIVGVWEAEGLSNDERCVLADAFLESIECVFREASPKVTGHRSDPTPILFWRGVTSGLQMMPVQDERRFKLRYDALRWLGKAAVQRTEQRESIVRLLEDNVLDSLKYVLKSLQESGEMGRLSQAIAAFVVPVLIPLTDTDLINTLDPLMRRTIGILARLDRDGRINTHFYATSDKESTLLKISEEQKEEVAAEVVVRAVNGDLNFQRLIYATDVVFSYPHPVPVEWTDAGFPADEELRIKVRCSLFTLLWSAPPELREIVVPLIIFHLSALDPALAYRILLQEDDLLSDNPEKARESRDRVGIDLLRSGYFDLQRNLVHAVQRFSQYDANAFSQFIGWIGKEAAHTLASRSIAPRVWKTGALLMPVSHFLGRALLSNQFDDEGLVLEHAKRLISSDDSRDGNNVKFPALIKWLEDKISVAENADDPFVAAWALRVVLLVLTKMNQDLQLNINGRMVKVSDWATNYILIALAPNINQPSEIEQRMIDRRRLASAALLLATFTCNGHKHLEAYSQEEDPLAIWLEHVWLVTTKLQVALVGLRGGVSNAAEAAAEAVQELELDTPNVPIDAFDPFAFGSSGNDIGITLTLTAILKVVHGHSDECPVWWTDTIHNLVEKFANEGSDEIPPSEEELSNRFGLAAPLRVRPIAQQLIKSLSISN